MKYRDPTSLPLDPVRPGEQWFFYWKTSAALWENRIVQSSLHEVIFIPVYWGFHADQNQKWDFGHQRPDCDLLRLANLLTQHKRKFCWVIPSTPAPYLPNGGVPAHVARTLSVSSDGVHLACIDQEEKLHKMYSFFEPKVFAAFSDFLQNFCTFLKDNRIQAPVWGNDYSYLKKGQSVSYFDDASIAFEQGFSRYLKNTFEGDLKDPSTEKKLKEKYTLDVRELFHSTMEGALSPFWEGFLEIVVLGGSPRETIERALPDGKSQLKFFQDLFLMNNEDKWISTALLRPHEKAEILPHLLDEHFGQSEIERRYRYQVRPGTLTEDWKNFGLVNVIEASKGHFHSLGLIGHLNDKYRWLYTVQPEIDFSTDWIEGFQDRIKIFQGEGLDRTKFSQILKLFMMGQTIVLDRSQLPVELDKRLQIFYLENNLRVESVNQITQITLCQLGEGKLFTFEGERLKSSGKQQEFWTMLFKFFGLRHPTTHTDPEVFSLWRIRGSTPQDLNYLDVRRVNFYNPTSYKKKVTVDTIGSFAFMKMIDPSHAEAKSVPHGVEINLLPQGRIALDFGHYEESR